MAVTKKVRRNSMRSVNRTKNVSRKGSRNSGKGLRKNVSKKNSRKTGKGSRKKRSRKSGKGFRKGSNKLRGGVFEEGDFEKGEDVILKTDTEGLTRGSNVKISEIIYEDVVYGESQTIDKLVVIFRGTSYEISPDNVNKMVQTQPQTQKKFTKGVKLKIIQVEGVNFSMNEEVTYVGESEYGSPTDNIITVKKNDERVFDIPQDYVELVEEVIVSTQPTASAAVYGDDSEIQVYEEITNMSMEEKPPFTKSDLSKAIRQICYPRNEQPSSPSILEQLIGIKSDKGRHFPTKSSLTHFTSKKGVGKFFFHTSLEDKDVNAQLVVVFFVKNNTQIKGKSYSQISMKCKFNKLETEKYELIVYYNCNNSFRVKNQVAFFNACKDKIPLIKDKTGKPGQYKYSVKNENFKIILGNEIMNPP